MVQDPDSLLVGLHTATSSAKHARPGNPLPEAWGRLPIVPCYHLQKKKWERIHWLLIQVTSSSALVMAPRFKPFPLTLVQGRQRTQVITPNCGAERSSQKPGRGLCLRQNSEGKRPFLPCICQIIPDTACNVSSRSMTVRESCCESPT